MEQHRQQHQGHRVAWKDVAAATGISPQLLSKLRHGDSVITNLATLVTLYRFFRCTNWEQLFTVEWDVPEDEVRLDQLCPGRRSWTADETDTTEAEQEDR
jgi:transcriptional regulator with XRE-family HTH domain